MVNVKYNSITFLQQYLLICRNIMDYKWIYSKRKMIVQFKQILNLMPLQSNVQN